jgi:hypothetical protein
VRLSFGKLAVDSDEHLIDGECVHIATVLSLKSACVDGSELDTPKSDSFAADGLLTP